MARTQLKMTGMEPKAMIIQNPDTTLVASAIIMEANAAGGSGGSGVLCKYQGRRQGRSGCDQWRDHRKGGSVRRTRQPAETEAIAYGALRAGVKVVSGYPGTPSPQK